MVFDHMFLCVVNTVYLAWTMVAQWTMSTTGLQRTNRGQRTGLRLLKTDQPRFAVKLEPLHLYKWFIIMTPKWVSIGSELFKNCFDLKIKHRRVKLIALSEIILLHINLSTPSQLTATLNGNHIAK